MEKKQDNRTFVFIWGMGENKCLGNGKKANEPVPYLIKNLSGQICTKISTGTSFTVVATKKGELYGWGAGKYSRFGIDEQLIEIPRKINVPKVVTQVSAGNWHTIILDNEGFAYGVGHNKYGSLGIGNFNQTVAFTKSLIDNCQRISAGDGFTLYLNKNGQLYSSGHHTFHGHQTKDNISVPKKLALQDKFEYIAAGFTHSACVTTNGEVYTWGQGNCYQLGHGTNTDEKVPKKVKALLGKRIIQTSCTRGEKNSHTMAVEDKGTVYTWGAGYKGKLGHQKQWSHSNKADQPIPRPMENLSNTKIVKAIGGGIHSSVITDKGKVLTFGCGSDGRLGHKQSEQYVYLYREGFPKQIDSLKQYRVIEYSSSYYHNACIAVCQK